ncbi:MAG: hypothetical protein NTU47_16155 [Ignavibacteriales bacterium]|nr:hypothetical protein [Ignavibacteriales bacterium]
MIALRYVHLKKEWRDSVERTSSHRFGSSVALLIGLVTAVAATAAVMAFVTHDGSVTNGLSDDWDDIIGV